MIDIKEITAVVLAGGKARRMQEQDKGLIRLDGVPLIRHVLSVVVPQVLAIKIGANRNVAQYKALTDCEIIQDKTQGFKGPLMGVASVLAKVDTPYVLLLPCDVPNINGALIKKLRAAMTKETEVCVAHDGTRSQYPFALLDVQVLPKLESFLAAGGESFKDWYATLLVKSVDCAEDARCFTNINTTLELAKQTTPYLHHGVPVLGFVGFSGAGKTTLLTQVVAQLKNQGKQVAVIKHTHHKVDMDTQGKDSYRFRESGAKQVIVASSKRFAMLVEQAEASMEQLLAALDTTDLDFIFFEGFKYEALPKIEVHRPEMNNKTRWQEDKKVLALASDSMDYEACAVPILDINDVELVADFVKAYGFLSI